MKRCLVLLSGGVDSTTAAYWARSRGYELEALFFDFGHSHIDGPRECAKAIAQKLGVRLHVVRTTLWAEVLEHSLGDSGVPWQVEPGGQHQLQVLANVPCFCAMAIAYAVMLETDFLALGIHSDDRETQGSLPTLLRSLEKFARGLTQRDVRVLAPFTSKNKVSVVRTGARLGVPFAETWSCGKDSDMHCGECADCVARQEAFAGAGIADPTEYKQHPATLMVVPER